MLKTIIIIAVLAVVLNFVLRLLYIFDYHKAVVVYRHAPGPCLEIYGAAGGSEDLTVLPDGRVFITQGLYPHMNGKILYFDFMDPTHKVKEMPLFGKINKTNPHFHGLTVWTNPTTGLITLMAVNHADDGIDYVEVFQFDEKKQRLNHIKSISDPNIVFANDLVAVSESSFYLTKSCRWIHEEIYFPTGFGQIVFYDGRNVRVVAGGFIIANGINISPDLRYIYMAELGRKQIISFERKDNNDLERSQEVFVDSLVDNIEVDPKTGDLWVGSHPRGLTVLQHIQSKLQTISPSQVFRIKTEGDKFKDVIEVYLDDGKKISASTVASVYKGRLIIGSLGSKALLCDLKYID